MKICVKFMYFLSRKSIWLYHLWNGSHFDSATMCWLVQVPAWTIIENANKKLSNYFTACRVVGNNKILNHYLLQTIHTQAWIRATLSLVIQGSDLSGPQIQPRLRSSWGQHGTHLGPVGPRWAPCWPHELYNQGGYWPNNMVGNRYCIVRLPGLTM